MISYKRILGIVLRHFYLLKHSVSRWIDIVYWPTVDLLLWGFITVYIQRGVSHESFWVFHFIGALIFWNILIRAQQGLAVGFLEDVWSRNLLHLFISPLSIVEYVLGLLIYSLFKAFIATVIMVIIASAVFKFKIWLTGFEVFLLVLGLLIFAWSVGLVTMAFILFFGQEAEILAWALALVFLPFSAVFYPVEVLPQAFQLIAKYVPTSYIFESMRNILFCGKASYSYILKAYLLNGIYLTISLITLGYTFYLARRDGKLTKIGE